jgi:NAD(P)H-flavin reductase/hemoglobin-like flavoprotein
MRRSTAYAQPWSGPSRAGAVSPDAQLLKESFALVEPVAEKVAGYFYGRLFTECPHLREIFPVTMDVQRARLLTALVRVIQGTDTPELLTPYLRQLGRDHRKFDVQSEHYEVVGRCLVAAIAKFAEDAWTEEMERAWTTAYTAMAAAMIDAADRMAARAPAWWNAEIVAHERRANDIAVIKVRPDGSLPYHAGQYVSLQTPRWPRVWRPYSVANAPGTNLLEFHLKAVGAGWVSNALVWHAKQGDMVRIGPPLGSMRLDPESPRGVVCVAGGVGLAPMKAIVDDMTRWNRNRSAVVFHGVRRSDDLYDLPALRAMADTHPWLTVVPAVSEEPTYVGEQGLISEVVRRYGPWDDHDVFVAGSPEMIRATLRTLDTLGVPPFRVHYDAFG